MIYRFGLFEFDAAAGELTSEGRRVPLEPQPARALALLLSRAGEVVTREDLRAYLWGAETHVDVDRGLGYCIGELRGALRDRADNPRFIQTLPRRGYRVIAPVTVSAGPLKNGDSHDVSVRHAVETAVPPPRTARWIAAALILGTIVAAGVWVNARRGQPPARPIVAVAVFDNETGESRHDRLVQGLSDVVVDRLTAIGPDRVGVVGNMPELRRTRGDRNLSAIARETRASFIILGQLQSKAGGLSLLLQLIRVDDGTHVWVRRIARPAGDALAGVDEETARLIDEAVRQHVLAS